MELGCEVRRALWLGWDSTREEVKNSVWYSVWYSVMTSVGGSTWNPVMSSVGNPVLTSLRGKSLDE